MPFVEQLPVFCRQKAAFFFKIRTIFLLIRIFMLDLRPTPAHVTAVSAAKLPRLVLVALLVCFIFTGLYDRGIWSVREGAAIGEIVEMARGDYVSWLFPMASGLVVTDHGPLSLWVGAFLVRIFSWMTPVTAARLSAALWFAVTTASIWYGTWYLARRTEAQPAAQVFAGSATYRDYGRLVADAATLFFVAMFGLVLRIREPNYECAELAFCAMAYFACAWSLTRPYFGAVLAGVAVAGLMLASSLIMGVTVLVATLFAFLLVPARGKADKKFAITIAAAALLFVAWPVAAWCLASEVISDYFLLWAQAQAGFFGLASFEGLRWFLEHIVWYLCPAWPFAVLAVVRWRRQACAPFMALPLIFLASWFAGFLASGDLKAEDLLNMTMAPLCTLAAFGLISASRSWKSMLDGFAVTVTTLGSVALWLYWLAWLMGFPPKMARSIEGLAPTATAGDAGWFGILAALLVSAFWAWTVYKRVHSRSFKLWNGPWLSAAGLAVLWILTAELFTPAFDANRSYEPVALAARSQLKTLGFESDDCLKTIGMSAGIASMISYYGHMPVTAGSSMVCRYELVRFDADDPRFADVDPEKVIRRPRTDERFMVRRFYPGQLRFYESVPMTGL